MDAEWKRKWVEALRSGEYVQGDGFLNLNGRMCCLGVLCDLVRKERGGEWVPAEINDGRMTFDGRWDYMPATVQKVVGIEDGDPKLESGKHISEFNDQGATFAEIADLIEKHL